MPWQRIDRRIGARRPPSSAFPPERASQRAGFVYATTALIGIHAFSVLTAREFEPLFSNYPMYARTMGLASPDEAKLMRTMATIRRDGRPIIHLLFEDGTERDVSIAHLTAFFFYGAFIYSSPYALLRRPGAECRMAAAVDPRTVAIRYGRHRFSVQDGTLAWGPVETLRTLNCR